MHKRKDRSAPAKGYYDKPRPPVDDPNLPENPDMPGENHNFKGASWAHEALVTYWNATGSEHQDCLSDLLCSLMHYCDRSDLNFQDELSRAQRNYDAETPNRQGA
jgi:hypothetical protein